VLYVGTKIMIYQLISTPSVFLEADQAVGMSLYLERVSIPCM